MSTGSLQIAEYLEALDASASAEYCIRNQIPILDVLPASFDGGDDVYNCLSQFLENGIPLYYLFNKTDVWGIYLKDITEPRYHTAIDMLLAHGSPADLML